MAATAGVGVRRGSAHPGLDQTGLRVQRAFVEFLESYVGAANNPATSAPSQTTALEPDYLQQLNEMKATDRTTLYVDFDNLASFNPALAGGVEREFFRFEPYLRRAVFDFVKEQMSEWATDDSGEKEFWVAFVNLPRVERLRELKTERIGQLVSFSATVTRTSEVRPELLYGSFVCAECNSIVRGVEQQCRYTTPTMCTNVQCANKKSWRLVKDESRFVDWQRVRVQENSVEVPAGSLPRTMDVICRHETVEQARPGDRCVFTGSLLVMPDQSPASMAGDRVEKHAGGGTRNGAAATEGVGGLRALGVRELHYRLVFVAHSVVNTAAPGSGTVNIRGEEDEALNFTTEEEADIQAMRNDPNIYDKLVRSVAPAVHSNYDIKRAILLMLLGGVHKSTHEGIQLRGDINVLIIGDPSCAKSQFLKYVAGFLPRAVYTSGKSSSAAGLTASVAKDIETGEYCIEAGALMLADNGICCIDEFDKMDPADQVAIHEAMEQQTISIAKAGINATLNARTSILAAANPNGGRYDKSKTLRMNVNLPPPILSRFDLILMMLDEPDEFRDYNVARHIVNIHRRRDEAVQPDYTTVQLQRYIKAARAIKPELTEEAVREATSAYVALRRGDSAPGSQTSYRITVRQLEALVRLSEAVARLHMEEKVSARHVKEARRLLATSIIAVDARDVQFDDDDGAADDDDYVEELLGAGAGDVEGGEDGEEGGERAEAGADAGAAPESGGEAPHAQQPAAAQALTVTFDKFQRVKNLLIERLREEETKAAQEGPTAEDGAAPDGGMKQVDLLRWYMDDRSSRGDFSSVKQMADEYRLVKTIIQHLVRREGALVIIEEPSPQEGVPANRLFDQRVLGINPNLEV